MISLARNSGRAAKKFISLQAESLYHRAGLLDEAAAASVIDAIEADEQLAAREKKILIDLYRTMATQSITEQE